MVRRIVMVVGALAALAAVALIVLLSLPWLLQDRVAETVDATLDEELLAEVEIGQLKLTLLSSFPLLEIDLDDVAVVGQDTWEGVELMRASRIEVGVDLQSALFGETFDVRRIRIEEPVFDIRIAEDGTSNLDLFPPEDVEAGAEVETGPFAVNLNQLEVLGLSFHYDDAASDVMVHLRDLDTEIQGQITDAHTRLDTATTIASLTVAQGGVTWLRDTQWNADVGLDIDNATGAMTLLDNAVSVNALTLAFQGLVHPQGNDVDVDLTLESQDTSFKSLLSLIPDAYNASFDGVETEGTLTVQGSAKGTYRSEGDDLPAFDFAVQVNDARFRYPDLPVGVDDIGLDLSITHPQGPTDATVLDVRRFTMSAGGSPLSGTVHVENPITDPLVDLVARGRLDLGALGQAMPDATGDADADGILDVDLRVAGRSSAFQASDASQVKANGTLKANNLRVAYPGLPDGFRVRTMDLTLSTTAAQVDALDLGWDKSTLSVTGTFDNVMPYVMVGEPLLGELALRSEYLDLRPFQGDTDDDGDAPEGSDEGGYVMAVPANLDFQCTADFDEMVTEAFTMNKVKGTLTVRDQRIELDTMSARMLGGKLQLGGSYAATTYDHADIDFRIETVKFDVARTFRQFETLRFIAPVLEGVTGDFDSDLALATRIRADGTPEFPTMLSSGSFRTTDVQLVPVAFSGVAKDLAGGKRKKKKGGFDTLDLSNTNLAYVIEQGTLSLQPFVAKLGGTQATVSGTTNLQSEKLNLKIDLPVKAKALQGAAFLGSLQSAVPDTLDLLIRVRGTRSDPKVKLSLQGADDLVDAAAGQLVDLATNALTNTNGGTNAAAVAEATREGDRLVAEARAQADNLRAEGAAAAQQIRDDSARESNKLVRQAKGDPLKLAAANQAASAAEKQANKAARKVEREANRKADKLVEEAEESRRQLIEAAGG